MPGSWRAFLPVAVLGLFAASSLAAAPAPGAPGNRSELDLGREAYARRDYAAAVTHLQAAVQALDRERERPLLAEAYLELGLSYMAGSGDAERALGALRESAEMAENPANALLLAATAAEKLGRAEEAAALRDRALRPAPAAAPQPATPPTPPAQPGAFEHFFGQEQEKPASPAKEKAKGPQAEKAKEKEKPKEQEKEKPRAGTAFDHFFKKPPDSPPEAPAPPPPGTI